MKSAVYKEAKYYEIAFNFTDRKKQVDLFETFIKKYSKTEVTTVLDLACGPATQLREMAKRNYKAIGLDISADMIAYLKQSAQDEKVEIEAIKDDMKDFKLREKVDFAFIMMGSIIYVGKNNSDMLAHLDAVAESLKPGGLYLIENLAINWTTPVFFKPQTWTTKEGGIKVKTTYKITPKDPLKQIVRQSIKLEVNDNGKHTEYIDENDLKIIFPEEFKLLVEINSKFEFLGFFERERNKLLKEISPDNIILLRRK